MEKISYERCVYESVTTGAYLKLYFWKIDEKNNSGHKGLRLINIINV